MKYFSENVKSTGKILLVMYAVTVILLFLLAVLMQKLQLDDKKISVGISIVYVVSCFLGGFFAGKIKKTRKFLWGLLLGLVYVIVMIGITMIAKGTFNVRFSDFAVNFLLCLGGGMLGGMLS